MSTKSLLSLSVFAFASLSLAQNNRLTFVPGELIVKFKESTSFTTRQRICNRLSSLPPQRIESLAIENFASEASLVLKVGRDPRIIASELRSNGDIEYAEPNWIYRTQAVANEPFYRNGQIWGVLGAGTPLRSNEFGSGAAALWNKDRIGSNDVIVGIIDEGVMVRHADLAANIWTNTQDPIDGKDNDGNGFVDDNQGWDFANNDRTVYDGTFDDHGTHVAGTIGAVGGNGVGVAGMNWRIKMIPLKFLGPNGGSSSNAIRAIDYLTNLKTRRGLNIVASNNSWGGGGYSQALADAIERANRAGILFIAAAGNSNANNDSTSSFPANYPNTNVISVGAIGSNGARASFSNFGKVQVDLFAPGDRILSTFPGSGDTSAYAFMSGTSMATPHVTGAVALYRSMYPSATPQQIRTALFNQVRKSTALQNLCVTGGRLNVSGF
jgi:subtilisin family serine protease